MSTDKIEKYSQNMLLSPVNIEIMSILAETVRGIDMGDLKEKIKYYRDQEGFDPRILFHEYLGELLEKGLIRDVGDKRFVLTVDGIKTHKKMADMAKDLFSQLAKQGEQWPMR